MKKSKFFIINVYNCAMTYLGDWFGKYLNSQILQNIFINLILFLRIGTFCK